ncbi:MAG: hypothetical protein QNJ60_16785 [Xenococcaceae cyanobacterium MO_188.B19]|nr:hypothetical protein [Xenococcaceae cyanobacterium MO_188.B19]
MISKLFAQIKTLFPILIKLYTPIVILLFFVVFVSYKTGVSINDFMNDPAAIAKTNPFLGAVSNIGILFWCAAASICFFSFALLRNSSSRNNLTIFLLASGFLTTILLLDDLFLFHEENWNSREFLFPNVTFLSEKIFFISYLVIVLCYLTKFIRVILKTDFVLLLLAFLFFGISISIDFFNISLFDYAILEDGAKLFGIVSWFGYFSVICFKAIQQEMFQNYDSETRQGISNLNAE